jgi:hypothetical protein
VDYGAVYVDSGAAAGHLLEGCVFSSWRFGGYVARYHGIVHTYQWYVLEYVRTYYHGMAHLLVPIGILLDRSALRMASVASCDQGVGVGS